MPISALKLPKSKLPHAFTSGPQQDDYEALLPTAETCPHPVITPKEVMSVALRLKAIIDTIIPIEIKESRITRPGGASVITHDVLELALEAAEGDKKACIIYALLTCKQWFRHLELEELYDAELNARKATACEVIAKRLIESESNQDFLFKQMLCRRFSIIVENEVTSNRNALEYAIDLHALTVIGSSGFQKCITWIWHGWIIQSPDNPTEFTSYKDAAVPDFWTHYDPDRIKTPLYQNALQLFFSIVYLGLYTGAVNTANPSRGFDAVEGLLYVFTLGYIFDEVAKFYHIGLYYFSFWSVFNDTLYSIVTVSFVIRLVALASPAGSNARETSDVLAYRMLAFCAPLMWSRLLLYLDMQKFFGAMLVVLKELMKESVVFFVLLIIIVIGFLQAFIGLDTADGAADVGAKSFAYMTRTVLASPEFEAFEDFAPPFAAILNYVFTFVVTVLLLNILIALFNSAYEKVYDNAVDEFLALFAQKTLRFVRAPDENVFVPPLNLIEVSCLILPFEWWMPRRRYATLNDVVLTIVYSPILFAIAFYEVYVAGKILRNRATGESDDDIREEWEDLERELDLEHCGWLDRVRAMVPHVESEPGVWEINELRKQVSELTEIVKLYRDEVKQESRSSDAGETETLIDGPVVDERV
ncbi:uncharacterized protein V1513DRAFT_444587 [Lipomyces chichibuensis]|uniref:uncharacterized protein n=1 Tax=Lipomyces chichibuensis TaxID=1546026 RepID=UPI003343FA8D